MSFATHIRPATAALIRPLLLAVLIGTSGIGGPASAQQSFSKPDDAAQALVDAARNPGLGALDRIFGPGGRELLSSGDEATDASRIADFLALAEKGRSVADGPDGRKILVFGKDGWRFPIPLRESAGQWTFDLAAGREEMRDRTIGVNELRAIAACAVYGAAQREYFASLHDDDPVQQYAQRIVSSPGQHDGLWWPAEDAADRSPLGDRIAAAEVTGGAEATSPDGYVYRILTRQGPNAPGGAYDYLVAGRMLAGFALVAWPERWDETGVMTFLCDQRGQVWQRNFGPRTSEHASRIRSLDPGREWSLVRGAGSQSARSAQLEEKTP